jgi:ring-1,2-phenylacetyl-CoA epoxidase subunit PaaE
MVHELYDLKVKEVIRETGDCVSVSFEIPDDLKDKFAYLQGQYLTLEKQFEETEEPVRRSYSLCSAPSENKWKVAVKEVHNGVFSNYVNKQLKKGDVLKVLPPDGRFFTKLNAEHKKQYVLFAAGSGITPMLSIIKEILHVEPHSSVMLFFGNQRTDQIIFLEELMALKNLHPERLSVHFLLSREEMEEPLFNGRINKEKLLAFAKYFFDIREVDEFFMCGPETMIIELRETLLELGVDVKKIHLELFGVQIQKPIPKVNYEAGHGICRVKVTLDGRTFEYPLPFNTESILDSALKQGAHLPFACKGGVCCTCKTKLISGNVQMAVNYGLEPDEIKNGYILSCQAFPTSEAVEVNFDK